MITKKTKSKDEVSTYASRYDLEDLTNTRLKKEGMPAASAKQLIEDELNLESIPILNLASFVSTWMEPEADELIAKCINKNFIDHDEYPEVEKIHERCVHILADNLHVPEDVNYAGTATVGSSEAIMLAGLAHKFNWRNRMTALGKEAVRPNIIMGANVQICWDKFARYFDVEPRIIPLKVDKYTITADDVAPLIDENTICVAAILGTTFTGEYDDIEGINQLLLETKRTKQWDIPLHVDAASGGFISMFADDGITWDFELEQVQSINISGHKYGLVYPGVGWLIFKDEAVVPKELVFDINYLGGNMPTYTLNFSRGSAMIVAQYYNFLRFGRLGYQKVVANMMAVSDYISEALLSLDVFELLGARRMEPVVTVALKDETACTVYDISAALRAHGWVVPAYSMPPNADEISCLRIVVKENLSLTLAKEFIKTMEEVLTQLKASHVPQSNTKRSGKSVPH